MPAQIADIVFVKNNSVLLVQQRKESAHGLWSFPGGHVENGETLEETVTREVKEELNANLISPKFMRAYSIETPRGTLVISTFTGELSGEITLKDDELMAYKWFTFDELQKSKDTLRGSCVIDQAKDALRLR